MSTNSICAIIVNKDKIKSYELLTFYSLRMFFTILDNNSRRKKRKRIDVITVKCSPFIFTLD